MGIALLQEVQLSVGIGMITLGSIPAKYLMGTLFGWVTPSLVPFLIWTGLILTLIAVLFHRLHFALRGARLENEFGNQWAALSLTERVIAAISIILGMSTIWFALFTSAFIPSVASFFSHYQRFLGIGAQTLFIAVGAVFAGLVAVLHFIRVVRSQAFYAQALAINRLAVDATEDEPPVSTEPSLQNIFAAQRKQSGWKVAGFAIGFGLLFPIALILFAYYLPPFHAVLSKSILPGVSGMSVLTATAIALSVSVLMTYFTSVLKQPVKDETPEVLFVDSPAAELLENTVDNPIEADLTPEAQQELEERNKLRQQALARGLALMKQADEARTAEQERQKVAALLADAEACRQQQLAAEQKQQEEEAERKRKEQEAQAIEAARLQQEQEQVDAARLLAQQEQARLVAELKKSKKSKKAKKSEKAEKVARTVHQALLVNVHAELLRLKKNNPVKVNESKEEKEIKPGAPSVRCSQDLMQAVNEETTGAFPIAKENVFTLTSKRKKINRKKKKFANTVGVDAPLPPMFLNDPDFPIFLKQGGSIFAPEFQAISFPQWKMFREWLAFLSLGGYAKELAGKSIDGSFGSFVGWQKSLKEEIKPAYWKRFLVWQNFIKQYGSELEWIDCKLLWEQFKKWRIFLKTDEGRRNPTLPAFKAWEEYSNFMDKVGQYINQGDHAQAFLNWQQFQQWQLFLQLTAGEPPADNWEEYIHWCAKIRGSTDRSGVFHQQRHLFYAWVNFLRTTSKESQHTPEEQWEIFLGQVCLKQHNGLRPDKEQVRIFLEWKEFQQWRLFLELNTGKQLREGWEEFMVWRQEIMLTAPNQSRRLFFSWMSFLCILKSQKKEQQPPEVQWLIFLQWEKFLKQNENTKPKREPSWPAFEAWQQKEEEISTLPSNVSAKRVGFFENRN